MSLNKSKASTDHQALETTMKTLEKTQPLMSNGAMQLQISHCTKFANAFQDHQMVTNNL